MTKKQTTEPRMLDEWTYLDEGVVPFDTLDKLIAAIQERAAHGIGFVKVADQGMILPKRQGRGFIQQPVIRVVATAFDPRTNEILLWDKKWPAASGRVTIHDRGKGTHGGDPTARAIREEVERRLVAAGFQVREGEYTQASVYRQLAGLDL